VTEKTSPSVDRESSPDHVEPLESWKEIAAYLNRDVRTVQRWERRGGLPVHRREENLGGVYAYPSELDVWRRDGHSRAESQLHETGNSTRQYQPNRRLVRTALISLAIVVFAGIVGLYSHRYFHGQIGKSEHTPAIVPFMNLPGWATAPTFSPDGKEVAFAWDNGHADLMHYDIYAMRLGSSEPRRLTFRPSRFVWPRWSPDGRSIAFTRESESESGLFLISSNGGAERKLLPLDYPTQPGSLGVSWTPDGNHLAFVETTPAGTNRIALLSLDSLQHRAMTQPPMGHSDEGPEVSPDGKTLAFVRFDSSIDYRAVYIAPMSGGEPTELVTPDGPAWGIAWYPNGQAILLAARLRGVDGLWKITLDGQSKLLYPTLRTKPGLPAFSAQGDRLVLNMTSYEENVWQVDLRKKRNPTTLISSLASGAEFPQYSPDGQHIAFQSERTGNWETWLCNPDGSNPVQLTSIGSPAGYGRWSPDGKQIVFDVRKEHNSEIYVVSRGGGSVRRIVTSSERDEAPSWSHDGRWIYYASKHGGIWQVWKTPAGGGHAVQVTKGGGYAPVESLNGKALYYAKGPDSPGIWQIGKRGNEEPVIDILPPGHWADWALSSDGIYFINPLAEPGPAIEFFSIATHTITPVLGLDAYPMEGAQGLAVSPDGHWLLYPKIKIQGDIVFLQNLQ
jgi:Tol biopolymer transport system component